jgi:hypothetical protein
MKPFFIYCLLSFICLSVFYSCSSVSKLKSSCLYNNKTSYLKKWSNAFIEIDIYNTAGTVLQDHSIIYPYGYFQLNNNASYQVLSDNVPHNGTWAVSDSCQLILDSGTSIQRSFDVLKLSNDSLTIRRKDGNMVYIQHYAASMPNN